jgi:hypothetical protein
MQAELSTLREFAKAGAERDEVGPGDGDGELHGLFGDVVYPITVQAEDVWFHIRGEQLDKVFTEVVGKFSEERFRFFFCEGTHGSQ